MAGCRAGRGGPPVVGGGAGLSVCLPISLWMVNATYGGSGTPATTQATDAWSSSLTSATGPGGSVQLAVSDSWSDPVFVPYSPPGVSRRALSGYIIGGVVGAALLLGAVAAFVIVRRRRARAAHGLGTAMMPGYVHM